MKTLPNGLVVFNATPHIIRFWREDWPEPVEVGPDEVVSAQVVEEPAGIASHASRGLKDVVVEFVTTRFIAQVDARNVLDRAYGNGADVVVGSIIAAQAYPGQVMAMVAAPGYERVPPAKKRMRPDKFTVF